MNRNSYVSSLLAILLFINVAVAAGDSAKREKTGASDAASAKKREQQRKALEKELDRPFERWLREDVAYIITDEERAAWKRLSTAEEREQFIEQFWTVRDPTPDTVENEYKEEHYRRIAYANEHFASGIPGWKTDRGRIYILHGPPDEIESHPSGGAYERPPEEGGGSTQVFPFEKWRYRHVEGVGDDVVLDFVDNTMTGEYHLTRDPSEKDALLHVPNAGLTILEQLGLAQKAARFQNTDGTNRAQALGGLPARDNEFESLKIIVDMQRPPARFKELEAVAEGRATSVIRYNLLPFDVRADFIRITTGTALAALTVQVANKDLSFQNKDGVERAAVNIFGRVCTMTRRTVQTFEDVLEVDAPAALLPQHLDKSSVYWQALPLSPGLYRLNLVLKDVMSGNVGTLEKAIRVPAFDEETLSASSLILSDKIEKVSTREIGRGQFVLGSTKVRPSVSGRFRRSGPLGLYLQVYNLGADAKTRRPSATIEYTVVKENAGPVFQAREKAEEIPGASGQQLTLEKLLPLESLQAGRYTLQIKVTDNLARRSIAPSASFTVY